MNKRGQCVAGTVSNVQCHTHVFHCLLVCAQTSDDHNRLVAVVQVCTAMGTKVVTHMGHTKGLDEKNGRR